MLQIPEFSGSFEQSIYVHSIYAMNIQKESMLQKLGKLNFIGHSKIVNVRLIQRHIVQPNRT